MPKLMMRVYPCANEETLRSSRCRLIVLLIVALTAGGLVVLLASRFPIQTSASPPSIAVATGADCRSAVVRHRRLRTLRCGPAGPGRRDGSGAVDRFPLAVGGGLVLAVLAYLIRANQQLRSIDNGAAAGGTRTRPRSRPTA